MARQLTRTEIGAAVRLLRLSYAVPILGVDLAKRMGMSKSMLSKLEAGNVPWTPVRLTKLAQALGLRRDRLDAALLELTENPPLGMHDDPRDAVDPARRFQRPMERAPHGAIPVVPPPHPTGDKLAKSRPVGVSVTLHDVGDPDAFALPLATDEMTPEFGQGDLLVFAPSAKVEDGDPCLVQLSESQGGAQLFRSVFFLDGGKVELRAYNTKRYRPVIQKLGKGGGVARIVKLVARIQHWEWKPKQ